MGNTRITLSPLKIMTQVSGNIKVATSSGPEVPTPLPVLARLNTECSSDDYQKF